MGMVAFFPWLQIREPIQVCAARLFLHHIGSPLPDGVTCSVSLEDLEGLLSPYRAHAKHPEQAHCLLQIDQGPIDAELDPARRAAIFRLARHLAVGGLATRRFDGRPLGSYSASGHYQVVIQQFTTPFTGSVVSSHRRKDGETRVLISPGAQHFQIPEHLVGRALPQLDLSLLHALEMAHAALDAKAWGLYEASITQFLMANSDSPDVPLDAESIATYSALERLVDASHSRPDFLRRVESCLAVVDDDLWAKQLRAELMAERAPRDVVSDWLKALYNLRGNAAHGYRVTKLKGSAWEQNEHLLAGAFVYPLALKCKLHEAGFYQLTPEDIAHIVGLDLLLADRPFFIEAALDGIEGRGRGWPRQMQVLGEALAAHELRGWIGDAYDQVTQRSATDEPPA